MAVQGHGGRPPCGAIVGGAQRDALSPLNRRRGAGPLRELNGRPRGARDDEPGRNAVPGCAPVPRPVSGTLDSWSRVMNELRTLDPFSLDPFDDRVRALLRPWRLETPDLAPRIRIDVSESDGQYAVKAEIPGVRKEDIDVRVDGNTVTISAEVKTEKEEKEGSRVLRQERQQGFASRSFTLACPVDDGRAQAAYKDGVLELTLPKKAAPSNKRVVVE
jgi:HSP20 family protein